MLGLRHSERETDRDPRWLAHLPEQVAPEPVGISVFLTVTSKVQGHEMVWYDS